jgi:copper chaperone NosL
MNNHRRQFLLGAACMSAAAAATLAGCGRAPGDTALPQAVEIDPATTCDLDGMLLADYAGPKAQIHYAGQAAPVFFCDTTEMFSALLMPEQARAVRAAYVQDMARADWDAPRGHWFHAHTGWYVAGSKRHGSMGRTIASFADEAGARRFAQDWGGRVLRYAEVTPELADMSGGAQQHGGM